MNYRDELHWSVISDHRNNEQLATFLLSDLIHYKGRDKPGYKNDLGNLISLLNMLRPEAYSKEELT